MTEPSGTPGKTPPPDDPETRPGGFEACGHLDEDDCIDLVAGLVPAARRSRMLDHAGGCAACERRLLTAGADLESLRSKPAPAGWAVPTSNGSPAPRALEPPIPIMPRRSVVRFAIPLALAAALVVVLLRTIPGKERGPVPRPYWMSTSGDLQRLRSAHGSDADSLFWQGLAAYESHDAGRAVKLLTDAQATGGLNDLRRLYLASALVNRGEARAALDLLEALRIEQLPMPWRDDARWMKYQSLVQLRRSAEARQLLDQLAEQPGRVGGMARRLLGR